MTTVIYLSGMDLVRIKQPEGKRYVFRPTLEMSVSFQY